VTFTVDIHHHILPGFFWQATNEGDHPVGGIAPPPWSRAGALSFLDDAGIDVAVTSISTPGVHTGDDTAARALARRYNELAAGMIRDRPDRFGGFACLPLPDVDGALAELAYALDDLRLDGVVLFSNARGTYLGDHRPAALQQHLCPHPRCQVRLLPRRGYRALPCRAVRHHRRDERHPRSRGPRDRG
jgi:predicted TIM-barrel fold metal-dependent hydrolase